MQYWNLHKARILCIWKELRFFFVSVVEVVLYFECPTRNSNFKRTLLLLLWSVSFHWWIHTYAYVCKAWEKFALCVRNFQTQNSWKKYNDAWLICTFTCRGSWAEIHSVTCPLPQFENHRKLCFRVKIPEGASKCWHIWSKLYFLT